MRILGIFALLVSASCLIPGVNSAPRGFIEQQQAASAPPPQSAAGGNKLVRAYDDAQRQLATAEGAAGGSRALYAAFHHAARAAVDAKHALAQVAAAKRAGTWTAGVKYQLATGQVLDAAQFEAGLGTTRNRAKADERAIFAKLTAAYRVEYPHASALQLADLQHLGPPAKVATITASGSHGRHHHRRGPKEVSCWIWSKHRAYLATCWNPDGTVALRHVWRKERVAASPAPPSGGGASASAAATASEDGVGSSLEASSSDVPEDSGDAASSDSGDASASDTASSDSSESGESTSGDSSDSSDTASSDSGDSSSSSDSSSSDAPAAPAEPACQKDGEVARTWSSCCSEHARIDKDEGVMYCCSSGPDCD